MAWCISSILRDNNLLNEFEPLMSYHRRQWIGEVGVDAISVYNRPRRTNNDSKSFHASLERSLRVRGPNIWECTDVIRNNSAATVRELRSFIEEGLAIRSIPKRKHRLNNERIKRTTKMFEDGEVGVGSFLNMISSCVQGILRQSLDNEGEVLEEPLSEKLAGDIPEEFRVTYAGLENDEDEEDENREGEGEGEERERIDTGRSDAPICIICKTKGPTTVLLHVPILVYATNSPGNGKPVTLQTNHRILTTRTSLTILYVPFVGFESNSICLLLAPKTSY